MDRNRQDGDGESYYTILARMEERQKGLIKKVEDHLDHYVEHIKQNDSDIRGLYKNQYIGYGIIITINFVILFFKH